MNAFWVAWCFSSDSSQRRCISFIATSFHEWSLLFSFFNINVCIRRLIMLATYFLLLRELFNSALLFLRDKSTLLAIIFESALLQFMQFIIVYSSSRFILSWLYCFFQKFALRALWLFFSEMLQKKCYEHVWIDQSSDLTLINLIRASHDAMPSLNLAHFFESFSALLLVVQHFLYSFLSSFF